MVGNLRAIANSVTRAINKNVSATLYISTGFNIVKFKQVPTYDAISIVAQVQPLSSKDLRQLDSLNIQGAEKSVYLNGAALGISRIKQHGGDLIVFPDGTFPEGNTFLVLVQLELWGSSTWSHVATILQDDATSPLIGSLVTDLTNPNNQTVVPAILTGI